MKIFKEETGATGYAGGDGTFTSGLPITRLRNKKGQPIGPVGEEIANSAAGPAGQGSQIASLGIPNPNKAANFGEPGVPKRHQPKASKSVKNGLWENNPLMGDMMRRSPPVMETRRRGSFAGAAVFEVSSKIFHNLTVSKRKGKHWRTYLEEDDCYSEIREWANKNKGPIVVRNENTGEMRFIRHGR